MGGTGARDWSLQVFGSLLNFAHSTMYSFQMSISETRRSQLIRPKRVCVSMVRSTLGYSKAHQMDTSIDLSSQIIKLGRSTIIKISWSTLLPPHLNRHTGCCSKSSVWMASWITTYYSLLISTDLVSGGLGT